MTDTSSQAQRDLAGSWMRMLAWWGPGVALIVITGNMGWWWHMAAWSLGLLWLGGLCVANAMHCGRLHCYFTGPLYLALAALTLVVGFHLVWLGPQTWNLIGLAALLGWVLFSTIPKWIWGRYWIGRGKAPNR